MDAVTALSKKGKTTLATGSAVSTAGQKSLVPALATRLAPGAPWYTAQELMPPERPTKQPPPKKKAVSKPKKEFDPSSVFDVGLLMSIHKEKK